MGKFGQTHPSPMANFIAAVQARRAKRGSLCKSCQAGLRALDSAKTQVREKCWLAGEQADAGHCMLLRFFHEGLGLNAFPPRLGRWNLGSTVIERISARCCP